MTRLTGKKAVVSYLEKDVEQQSKRYSRPVGLHEKSFVLERKKVETREERQIRCGVQKSSI